MKAFKCDRCGSLFESEERKEIFNNYPTLYIVDENDTSQLVDLCKNCATELKEWLGNHGPLYKFLDKTETCQTHCRGCNQLTWGDGPDNPYYECHKYNTKVKFFSKSLNDISEEDFKKENSVGDPYEDGGL